MKEYTRLTASLFAQLESLVPGRFVSGEQISPDYARDESPFLEGKAPEAVAFPQTTEEAASLLRFCNEHRIPVTPRGGGTGLVGGAVADCGGIILSLEKMNHILAFDTDNLTVHVQSGVPVGELQRACADHGLFYPPDPAEKLGSLGGNLSTNAGGMRAVRYGVTRNYVLAATAVLADGSVLHLGGNTIKNSSGYPLLQLLIGSEGTLAVITEITLRLLPASAETVSLLAPFSTTTDALHAVSAIRKHGNPRSIEFMEASIVRKTQEEMGQSVYPLAIDGTDAAAFLLVTLDGEAKEALIDQAESLGGILLDGGALDILVADTPKDEQKLFSIREDLLNVIKRSFAQFEELDTALSPDKMALFLNFLHQLCDEHRIHLEAFGHAGDGNLHTYLCSDQTDKHLFSESIQCIMEKAYQKAMELGGVLSGEHGIGFTKKEFFTRHTEETQRILMEKIKLCFDPNCILNPHKIF